MENKDKILNKNKYDNIKVILKLLIIVGLTTLILVSGYAWFADKSNPEISASNIKVTSADGLVIKLTPDSVAQTSVSLNKMFGDFENFELKQVSSANAVDFFKIDFGQGLALSKPKFIKLETPTSSNLSSLGYINYDFYLETEEYDKYVYLHKDSYIDGIAKNAVRIAISITDEDDNVKKIIFGTTKENGVDSDYTTEAIIKEGEFVYGNIASSFISNQVVHTFDEYQGGKQEDENAPIDENKLFAIMPAKTQIKVNLKIWLEGGDIDCTNEISKSNLDLLIKFASTNKLDDAPNVYANTANYTIENLSTDMEYSYDLNDNSSYIKVEDANMTFNENDVVYVRYYKIDGVRNESNVTTVNF